MRRPNDERADKERAIAIVMGLFDYSRPAAIGFLGMMSEVLTALQNSGPPKSKS